MGRHNVMEKYIRELADELGEVEVTKDAKVPGRYNLKVTHSDSKLNLFSFDYVVGEREQKIIDFEFYGGTRKSLTVECVAHAVDDNGFLPLDSYNVYFFSEIPGAESSPLIFRVNEENGAEEKLLPDTPYGAEVFYNIVLAVSVLDYYSKNVLKEEDYQNAQTDEYGK